MSAITTGSPPNKVAAHWAQKLHNKKLRQFAFLDLGATGAAPAEDEPDLGSQHQTTIQKKHLFFLMDAQEKQQRKCYLSTICNWWP